MLLFRVRTRLVAVTVLLCLGIAPVVWAQWPRIVEGPIVRPRFAPDNFNDGALTICKLMFTSVRREANGYGWSTDYPFGAINLMIRVSELTKTRISKQVSGAPQYWVVRLMDDALFDCPFLVGSDVGTIGLSADEAGRLRDYLLKGGFLWVDDFWGTAAAAHWSAEIHKALPEYPIVEVPPEHPIRHTVFDVAAVPQVPGINFWRFSGGTSERGEDSPYADFKAIADSHGRIMVAMTHNTDIGDSMEREAENPEFFARFSPAGYALTINLVVYALTH
jgi:uncharacterized protein DUF4159